MEGRELAWGRGMGLLRGCRVGALLPKLSWQIAVCFFAQERYAPGRVPTRGRRAQSPSGRVGPVTLRLRRWLPSCIAAPRSACGKNTVINKQNSAQAVKTIPSQERPK